MFQNFPAARISLLLTLVASPLAAQRLPNNATPTHYKLALAPDIASATFTGEETLDVTLATPSPTITLNALELKIATVTAAGQSAQITFDPSREQATFTFPRPLPAGAASLHIVFSGILNDKLRGFYLSKTKTRNYAVTQFESTDARRAFPSFDEPALKATFDVALTIDSRDTAISNTNITSDTPALSGKPGNHTLTFATTPRMSTYLVAFLVGDFACTSGSADNVPIRVCSTPDKVKLTTFALAGAEHFLHYYDQYFGIKYPMPKLDLIGIPDFEAGAMENFGAITYRETELLVDEKDGGISAKKRVSSTVAHEMAHQWFGDMVTMQWWDNLWLNEGFATWMQNKASNEWHPEWHFEQDTADDLDGTLNYDAARTTRTIRATANTPAEIAEMFDGIAYGKAGAVIGMVENYVTPPVFQQGVHTYLAAHLYANATAEDFWNAQTSTSHQPVDKIMSSFVDRPGVPLLTFANPQAAGVPVRETRFFLGGKPTPDQREANDVNPGWTIPVCVKTAATPVCKLVTHDSADLLTPADPTSFFFANAGDHGYYRVNYSPAQLKAITAAAETKLSVPERISFLGDRWALTRAGQSSVGDFLNLAFALKQDPNSDVLDSALGSVASVRTRIASEQDKPKLNAVIRAQFAPVWAALSQPVKGESYERSLMRSELFQALGSAGDPTIQARAHQITDDLLAGHKVDDEDLVDASVALAARTGDTPFYDRLQIVSQKAEDPGLQSEALETLAQFRRPELIIRTLQYATSGQVRNQDSWVLIAIELSQPETRDIAWDWVQKNWPAVKAQLTTSSGSQVVTATGSFCTVEGRDQVAAFFKTHPVEASERSLSKAIDSINDCIHLRTTQEPNLKTWLSTQPTPAEAPAQTTTPAQ